MKIIKTISLFTFLFFINTISFGQYFGLKAGVDFPRLVLESENFSSFNHPSKGVNMHLAFFYDLKINGHFTLMPALKYSRKRMEYKEGFVSWSEYRLSYFEIPILAKVFLNKKDDVNERLRIYAIAGPYVSIGIKGDFIRERVYPNSVWRNGEDEYRLKRKDYGFTYGAGFEKKALQVEIFHSIGLADIANSFDGLTSAKNQSIGVSIALLFIREKNDY